MHAVTPYLIRAFDQYNKENKTHDYFNLSNVRGKDTLDLIHKYMVSKSSAIFDYPEEKKVYKFDKILFNSKNRTVTAFLITGSYGVKSEILDKNTGKIRFPKSENDAEVLKHFVSFTIPREKTEGVALFHKSRGIGIKSLMASLFKPYFTTHTKNSLQINPYAHSEAIHDWVENARVTELKVSGFVASSDVANNIAMMGECNTEFSISPKSYQKGVKSSLGPLKSFFNLDTNPDMKQMVTYLEGQGKNVRTVADLNGTTRTFDVGTDRKGVVCDIPFGEDEDTVELEGGQPKYESVKKWALVLTNDILVGVYGRKKAFQLKDLG